VNLGDVFTSNVNGTVTALGIYAGNNATYVGPETVGLYNAAGVLLTSTTVSNSDPLFDGYYWVPTASASVTAGSVYTVVDQVNQNGWGYGPVPTNNWATFNYNDYIYTSSLPATWTSPNTNGSGPAYYGGNVAIPEGGAAWLYLLVAGAASFGAMLFASRSRLGSRAQA
jgi:hypothetical protein